jgi:hypothetical protein
MLVDNFVSTSYNDIKGGGVMFTGASGAIPRTDFRRMVAHAE